MSGRESERGEFEPGAGYDDWFDEPEPPPQRRRRSQRRASEPVEDDAWVVPEVESRSSERTPIVIAGRTLTPTQVAIIAVSGLVVLLAILAAAGVFSSGSSPPAALTTTQTKPATTAPANTTPATTPTTPAAKAPTTTLKPGDTGAQVKLLQLALTSLGYSAGKADGGYGPSTTQAVKDFQTAQGLTADGVVGSQTLTALKSALAGGSSSSSSSSTGTGAQAPTTALKPGDSGAQVKLLQLALTSLGYATGGADGSYGPGTTQAVKDFQTAQGLTADGVVGSKTLAALQQQLSRG